MVPIGKNMTHDELLVRNWPIVQCADGMWRSVCHKHTMAGPGYRSKEEATRMAPLIRHDAAGAQRMVERYKELGLQR